jgi:hypothetical protein
MAIVHCLRRPNSLTISRVLPAPEPTRALGGCVVLTPRREHIGSSGDVCLRTTPGAYVLQINHSLANSILRLRNIRVQQRNPPLDTPSMRQSLAVHMR